MSYPNSLETVNNPELILTPFLGEMGFEVRAFIAMIEPWLRSGWKIPTKRPCLYPPGTTVSADDFYDDLKVLAENYKCQPIMYHLAVYQGQKIERSILEQKKTEFRADLHKLLKPVIDRPGRPNTYWDEYLTRPWSSIDTQYLSAYSGLRPSYKPADFLLGSPDTPAHIGVQFRRMDKWSIRDSDVEIVEKFAEACAAFLGLPLLCYGEPNGCVFPKGIERALAHHPIGSSGLAGDLRCLSRCVVMISPDSGWADLMAWLQVPTILQKVHTPYTFYCARPFEATLALYEPDASAEAQILKVLGKGRGHVEHGDSFPPTAPTHHLASRFFSLEAIGWETSA